MQDYRALLDRFVVREVAVEEFQRTYLEKFKCETRSMDEHLFGVLDTLFGHVDSFTADAELLQGDPKFYLNEAGLRERVSEAVEELCRLK